jgi:hypothetical protein
MGLVYQIPVRSRPDPGQIPGGGSSTAGAGCTTRMTYGNAWIHGADHPLGRHVHLALAECEGRPARDLRRYVIRPAAPAVGEEHLESFFARKRTWRGYFSFGLHALVAGKTVPEEPSGLRPGARPARAKVPFGKFWLSTNPSAPVFLVDLTTGLGHRRRLPARRPEAAPSASAHRTPTPSSGAHPAAEA